MPGEPHEPDDRGEQRIFEQVLRARVTREGPDPSPKPSAGHEIFPSKKRRPPPHRRWPRPGDRPRLHACRDDSYDPPPAPSSVLEILV